MPSGTFSEDELQLIRDLRTLTANDQRIICDVAAQLADQAIAAFPRNVVPLLAHPITHR